MPQPEKRISNAAPIAMIVIGALIFIPSGLCTGVMVIGSLIESLMQSGGAAISSGIGAMALIVGGPFVAVGGVLLWSGIRELRANRRKNDAQKPPNQTP